MQFANIPGLTSIKQHLLEACKNNHIAHAQLFKGESGSAIFGLALALATYILCKDKKENDSCGVCNSCYKISKLIHPDINFFFPYANVENSKENTKIIKFREFLLENIYGSFEDWIEFAGTENKQNIISKSEIKSLIEVLSLKPVESEYRFIFIWLPEYMHPSASNAILKVLEEPPKKTVFFLLTFDYEAIIPTILSRTQLVVIPNFTQEEVVQYLTIHNDIPIEKAKIVSMQAKGNINYALDLLKHDGGLEQEYFRTWMKYCYRKDYKNLQLLSEEFDKMSKMKQRNLILFSSEILRNALISKYNESLTPFSDDFKEFIIKFGNRFANEVIEKVYVELNSAYNNLVRSSHPKITHLAVSLRVLEILK